MGMINIVNMCSHLTNASKARLGITSVPHTKYNMALALALQRSGFLAFVTRGGPHPPDPSTISTFEPDVLTTANVGNQRLWVGLKYNAANGGEPVLGRMEPVTRPKRIANARLPVLDRLSRGFDAHPHRGLNIGETMIIATDLGTMDVREAVERKVGGTILCRVGPA
ncbi:ribosomal protein S8 [Jackrogersella minutella]|nr:ribosomal protein S8 [Jackrogersella minutella]